jgi:hypothetical protein
MAVRALEVAEEHHFVEITAECRFLIGQAIAHRGSTAEGVALIRQGIASLIEIGQRNIPVRIGGLAEAERQAGSRAGMAGASISAIRCIVPGTPSSTPKVFAAGL